jgi:hypothetical protein
MPVAYLFDRTRQRRPCGIGGKDGACVTVDGYRGEITDHESTQG